MFKKYIPKESWDYEKTLVYALKKLNQRSYSTNLLKDDLLLKTTETHADTIIHELVQKGLLDDQTLCNQTAQEWVEKKPISKIQLYKKLRTYKFQHESIQTSMNYLEIGYDNLAMEKVGGQELSLLKARVGILTEYSLWDLLALSACILTLECSTKPQDTQSMAQKLQLKGYTLNSALFEAIQKLIDKSQVDS